MATLNRPTTLKLDAVPSSQPELGPNIPDGGYGWAILTASVFFQTVIPGISVAIGVFLMVSKVINGSLEPTLWNSNFVYTALFFNAVWIITDPWCRRLCTCNTHPKFVITAGTCLTCAGLLLLWYGINVGNQRILYVLAGIFSGGGASMIMCQVEIQILQYFNLKLAPVSTILNIANAVGFIITPMALGHYILRRGVLETITWYQAFILIGVLLSIVFKLPKYLTSQKRRYKLVQGILDDEEDIFAKSSTELQSPRGSIHSNRTVTEAAIEMASTPTKNKPNQFETDSRPTAVVQNELLSIDIMHKKRRESWESFGDESIESQPHIIETPSRSFSQDFHNDLYKIEKFEDSYMETPKPLFTDNYVNNNVSYSFESPTEHNDPVVFEPKHKESCCTDWTKNLEYFKQPTFYKSLLFYINLKFSSFVLWTLFPTYLYLKIDFTNISLVLNVVSCISLGHLLFALVTTCTKTKASTRAIYLWIFCWIGTTGFIFISDSKKETSLVFGAVLVTFSIGALQIMGNPLLKLGPKGETTNIHKVICTLTGLSFLLFLITDLTYKNCFRLTATLQFLSGSLWFTNFVYKKIKKQMT